MSFWEMVAKVGGIAFTFFMLIIVLMLIAMIVMGELRAHWERKDAAEYAKKIDGFRNDFE